MKVTVLSHTENPDETCCIAAMQCYRDRSVNDIEPNMRILRGCIADNHLSVLEHASITFGIEGVSRSLTHQLERHRLASYSELSQRYVAFDNAIDHVVPHTIEADAKALNAYNNAIQAVEDAYHAILSQGIPAEDARYLLTNSTASRVVVTMNLRELRHFIGLRACSKAQWEIRELANAMLALAKKIAPVAMQDAGPNCEVLGYCPEKVSCGRKYTLAQLKSEICE